MKMIFPFLFFVFMLKNVLQAQTKIEINKNMTQVANELSLLLPYLVSEADFNDPAKGTVILGHLKNLEKYFAQNQSHFSQKQQLARLITHQTLQNLITQSTRTFQEGKKEISRRMLKATPGLCLNCHMQDDAHAKIFRVNPNNMGSSLAMAEFYQITRRPKEALAKIDQFFSEKKMHTPAEVGQALENELKIMLFNRFAWDKIELRLQDHLKYRVPTKEIRSQVSGWLEGVKKAKTAFSAHLRRVQDIPIALEKSLGTKEPSLGLVASPLEEVIYFKLRSELFYLLNGNPKEEDLPEIFYWLSYSERALSYDYFYSLADTYLKACIEHWPKSVMAKKCYEEYEDFVEFSFTGSSGTEIPSDIAAELKALKLKITTK
jgi:hypothetical protein